MCFPKVKAINPCITQTAAWTGPAMLMCQLNGPISNKRTTIGLQSTHITNLYKSCFLLCFGKVNLVRFPWHCGLYLKRCISLKQSCVRLTIICYTNRETWRLHILQQLMRSRTSWLKLTPWYARELHSIDVVGLQTTTEILHQVDGGLILLQLQGRHLCNRGLSSLPQGV